MPGGTAVKEQRTATGVESSDLWDQLEACVRGHSQRVIQPPWEEDSPGAWVEGSRGGA